MINFTSRTQYYLCPNPTDMRNGRNGLAGIVQDYMIELMERLYELERSYKARG